MTTSNKNKFKGVFFNNYDLVDEPGEETSPGAGVFKNKNKSVSDFLKNKRKRRLRKRALVLKTAGRLKYPEALATSIQDWASTVYCKKVLSLIQSLESKVEKRDKTFQFNENNCQFIKRKFSKISELLPEINSATELKAPHFSKSFDESTGWNGYSDNIKPASFHLFIYHTEDDLYNFSLTINTEDSNVYIPFTKGNSKQKVVNYIYDKLDEIHAFLKNYQSFTNIFYTHSNDFRRNLKELKVECLINIKGDYVNDQTFVINPKDILLKDQYDLAPDRLNLKCKFIFSKSIAKKIHDGNWHGLWDDVYIYITENLPTEKEVQQLFKPDDLVSKIIEIKRVVMHELGHVVQTLIESIQKLQETGGLPSERIRETNADPDGNIYDGYGGFLIDPKTQNNVKIDHELRDVEFYTRLEDLIANFKNILTKYPVWSHKNLFDVFICKMSVKDFKSYLSTDDGGPIKKMNKTEASKLIDYSKLEQKTMWIEKLKHHNPRKCGKAISEFTKAVSGLI